MSLRVNLIISSEQRSGSRINIRSITRLANIVIPAIIIFVVGSQILKYSVTISKLRMLESKWVLAEPKQNQSHELLAQLHYNMRTAAELEEWKKSRINWNSQLQAVLESAPKTVQVTRLFVSSELEDSAVPSPPIRNFMLTIDGKNSGKKAMGYIETFKQNLEGHCSKSGMIESIEVSNYEADSSDNAAQFDRVFQVECIYMSLPEEPIQ